jgi:hypothetical protein
MPGEDTFKALFNELKVTDCMNQRPLETVSEVEDIIYRMINASFKNGHPEVDIDELLAISHGGSSVALSARLKEFIRQDRFNNNL